MSNLFLWANLSCLAACAAGMELFMAGLSQILSRTSVSLVPWLAEWMGWGNWIYIFNVNRKYKHLRFQSWNSHRRLNTCWIISITPILAYSCCIAQIITGGGAVIVSILSLFLLYRNRAWLPLSMVPSYTLLLLHHLFRFSLFWFGLWHWSWLYIHGRWKTILSIWLACRIKLGRNGRWTSVLDSKLNSNVVAFSLRSIGAFILKCSFDALNFISYT